MNQTPNFQSLSGRSWVSYKWLLRLLCLSSVLICRKVKSSSGKNKRETWVNEGDILLEIMSDKTNMELEAEDSGVLLKITRQAGEIVPVTEVIGYIGAEGEVVADNAAIAPAAEAAPQVEKVADVETPAAKPQPQVAIVHEGGKIRATPKARKVAREMGIDLAQVLGTGAKGRIHADDVENFKGAQPKATPLARKIAADLGIDLATVSGTGIWW